jgi:hypothetical protein
MLVDHDRGDAVVVAVAASAAGRLEPAGILAAIRDADDDRVRPPEQDGPQPPRRLVVQDPLPPPLRHVLGRTTNVIGDGLSGGHAWSRTSR